MIRALGAGATLILAAVVASSCGGTADAGEAPEDVVALPRIGSMTDSSAAQVRLLWMALAEDPLHHVSLARALLREGDRDDAARELDLSAYLFRWAALYAGELTERRTLIVTAQELEAAARRAARGEAQDVVALDHRLAVGLRAMAELHAGAALEQWGAGEHTRAKRLMHASADEVRRGFALSGERPGRTIERALAVADTVAERLDSRSPPGEHEIRGAIEGLREGVSGLGEALDSH